MADTDGESQAFLVEQALASAAFQQAPDNRPVDPLPDNNDAFEFRPSPLSHARTEPSAMLRELAAAEGHALQDTERIPPQGRPPRRPPLPPSLNAGEAPSLSATAQKGGSSATESSFDRQDTPGMTIKPTNKKT